MGLKVLELFSGIGGMRCGIKEGLSRKEQVSFKAVDVNRFCNDIYSNSYSDGDVECLDISALSREWLEAVGADIWTMSPPCQPYTRQGNMQGSLDERARPLHHLIDVMRSMSGSNIPKLILIENVKNFEISDSFAELKQVLESLNYSLYGYFLNPLYMGFPNSRLRFFLVASLRDPLEQQIPFLIHTNDPNMKEYEFISTTSSERRISDFLCVDHTVETDARLTIPEGVLAKRAAMCFDVVSARSKQCLCFTRAYTKYINGTGSVLLTAEEKADSFDNMDRPIFKIDSMQELHASLRYFCPLEAARLNGFKEGSLKLPNGCQGGAQLYRAVGNAVNPDIVAFIVRRHFYSFLFCSRL